MNWSPDANQDKHVAYFMSVSAERLQQVLVHVKWKQNKNNIGRFANYICFILHFEFKFVFKTLIHLRRNIPVSLTWLYAFTLLFFCMFTFASSHFCLLHSYNKMCFDINLNILLSKFPLTWWNYLYLGIDHNDFKFFWTFILQLLKMPKSMRTPQGYSRQNEVAYRKSLITCT